MKPWCLHGMQLSMLTSQLLDLLLVATAGERFVISGSCAARALSQGQPEELWEQSTTICPHAFHSPGCPTQHPVMNGSWQTQERCSGAAELSIPQGAQGSSVWSVGPGPWVQPMAAASLESVY